VEPRYGQQTFNAADRVNQFQQVVSPDPQGEGLWIHQDAWFYLASLREGYSGQYTLKNAENGVYAFVLEGEVDIEGQTLTRRDGMGITGVPAINLHAASGAELLLMEVPMQLPSL